MDFDFADVLLKVMERNASDLHLTAGSPPMVRQHGRLHPLDYPHLTPQDTREIVYSILTNDQRQRLENDWQIDFAYSIPGQGALPRQRLLPARLAVGRLPPDPARHAEARARSACRRCSRSSPRSRAASCSSPGPTGSGKSTTLAAMIDLINEHAARAHPHDRGPDRVPAPAQELHRQPARAGRRRAELRARPEGRAAPGPGRDPRRRDARPRDDLDRADRGRDRPPRVRHAAHAGHRADGRPHRRRVPARRSSSRCACSSRWRSRASSPSSCCRRPTARAARSAAEVLVPTPAVRNLIREGKTHQIYSALQTGGAARHADDGRLAGRARARAQDHPRARRGALARARGAAPPDGHREGGVGHGHLRLQGTRPRRRPHPGRDRGRRQAGRRGAAALQGPDRRRHRGAGAGERRRHPRALQEASRPTSSSSPRGSSRRWCPRACRCCARST